MSNKIEGINRRDALGLMASAATVTMVSSPAFAAAATKPNLASASHWMMQPVIDVAEDGKSATARHYLLHFDTRSEYGAGISDGMYPNNVIKMEDGVFKLDVGAPDQPYLTSASWKSGWSRDEPKAPARAPVKQAIEPLRNFPADIPRTSMPLRHHGSAPGDMISWPDIKPMWFSYKNPVSGRMPENYCPDLKTCEKDLVAQKQKAVESQQKMLESPREQAQN